jgi:hypothetical protein
MNREDGGPGRPWAVGLGGVAFVAPAVRFDDFDLQSLWVDEYLWTLTVPRRGWRRHHGRHGAHPGNPS